MTDIMDLAKRAKAAAQSTDGFLKLTPDEYAFLKYYVEPEAWEYALAIAGLPNERYLLVQVVVELPPCNVLTVSAHLQKFRQLSVRCGEDQ